MLQLLDEVSNNFNCLADEPEQRLLSIRDKEDLRVGHADFVRLRGQRLAELRLEKFGLQQQGSAHAVQNQQFLDLLNFAIDKKVWDEGKLSHCYVVVLEWALNSAAADESYREILYKGFSTLYADDRVAALHFHRAYRTEFAKYCPEAAYLIISLQLEFQKQNPVGILPLLSHYFFEPNFFSGLLLWMLRSGASAKAIIDSGILDQFLQFILPLDRGITDPNQNPCYAFARVE